MFCSTAWATSASKASETKATRIRWSAAVPTTTSRPPETPARGAPTVMRRSLTAGVIWAGSVTRRPISPLVTARSVKPMFLSRSEVRMSSAMLVSRSVRSAAVSTE